MAAIFERVDRLDEALSKFMEQTSMMLASNHEDIAEMRASNARILASHHEENAAILASNARIIAANHEDISEMRASNARTDRQLLEMQQQAAMDREQAEKDRQRGDKDREQADKDREQADKDRQQVEKDRQQVEKDRQQVEKDRQQIEKDRQRGDKERQEFNRQLAGISDRLGSLIEDMVAPNAPRIARTLFEGDEVLTSAIRVKRRHPSDPGLNIELDLLVVGSRHLLVGEAKSKVTVEKAVAFLEKMRSIHEYFPEFSGFTILPLIASVGIESSLVAHLSRLRIYALAFGDETMEILNEGAF